MNININIKIPLKSGGSLVVTENLLLNPLYITENELLSIYLTKYTEDQFKAAREVAFYSSLKADEIIGNKIDSFTSKEKFSLKRQLTLCLATISFGNKFNTDYVKSLSRSKSLAEFSVSTSSTNDPQFVLNIIKEAQQCVDDIKSALTMSGDVLIRTFVKGANNLANYDSNRLWHHSNLAQKSKETYASEKKFYNGRYYKNGGSWNVPKS